MDDYSKDVCQLLTRSTLSVAVLGKGEGFVLVRLDEEGDPAEDSDDYREAMRLAQERDFIFCGVLAYADGQVGAKYAPSEADNPAVALPMFMATREFTQLLIEHLQPKPDVSVAWLEELYALPDVRE